MSFPLPGGNRVMETLKDKLSQAIKINVYGFPPSTDKQVTLTQLNLSASPTGASNWWKHKPSLQRRGEPCLPTEAAGAWEIRDLFIPPSSFVLACGKQHLCVISCKSSLPLCQPRTPWNILSAIIPLRVWITDVSPQFLLVKNIPAFLKAQYDPPICNHLQLAVLPPGSWTTLYFHPELWKTFTGRREDLLVLPRWSKATLRHLC